MKHFKNLSDDAKAIVASNLTVATYLVVVKEQIRVGIQKEPNEPNPEQKVLDFYYRVFDFLENNPL